MNDRTQNPQNPPGQDTEKPPYERLDPDFRSLVDRMVKSRGELLTDYKALIDDAREGKPIRGSAIDDLQAEYTDKQKQHQADIIRLLTATNKADGESKEDEPKKVWLWDKGGSAGQENQPTTMKEGKPKQQADEKNDKVKTQHITSGQDNIEPKSTPDNPDIPADGKPKPSVTDRDETNPLRGTPYFRNDGDTPFNRRISKMGQLKNDFVAALEQKIQEWDDDHAHVLRGLDIRPLNKTLMQQDKQAGLLVPENIALAPETKDTAGLFKDLLSKNPGIALADIHIFDDSFATVEKHMDTLKASGVDTIYIEHDPAWVHTVMNFTPEQMAQLEKENKVDDITIRGAHENALNYRFHTSEDMYAGMLSMMKAAKERGIAVKGMDEYPAANALGLASWRRIGSTNAIWTDNIRHDREVLPPGQQKTGKFVVIGGMAHFITDGIVDDRLGLPTIGFTKKSSPDQPEIQAVGISAMPDFLITSEGYLNTRALMRAYAYDKISKDVRKVPMPLGTAVVARIVSNYTELEAKIHIIDMREEFRRDRPPSPEPLGGPWKWVDNGVRYDGEADPGAVSPNATPVNPPLKDKVQMPSPVEFRDEVISPPNTPPLPPRDKPKGRAQ